MKLFNGKRGAILLAFSGLLILGFSSHEAKALATPDRKYETVQAKEDENGNVTVTCKGYGSLNCALG